MTAAVASDDLTYPKTPRPMIVLWRLRLEIAWRLTRREPSPWRLLPLNAPAAITVALTLDASSADVDTVLILINVIGLSHVIGVRITGAP